MIEIGTGALNGCKDMTLLMNSSLPYYPERVYERNQHLGVCMYDPIIGKNTIDESVFSLSSDCYIKFVRVFEGGGTV